MKHDLDKISKRISITMIIVLLIILYLISFLSNNELPFDVGLISIIIISFIVFMFDLDNYIMYYIYYFFYHRILMKTIYIDDKEIFTCMKKEKQEDVKDEIDVSLIKNENKQINLDRLKTTSIGKLISEIDMQIQKGYVFESISIDRYKDGYRKECLDILSSKYEISNEQEAKILTILQTLRDNMYDKKEKQHTLDTDVSIKAMEELLKYDGVINDLKM